jgi:hypothetical protein
MRLLSVTDLPGWAGSYLATDAGGDFAMPIKKKTSARPEVSATGHPESLHDAITQYARELWKKYGQPAGRDEEIWLEAERRVLGDKARKQRDG